MRRKAGAGRPPPEIARVTAAKAVRWAVVQAADDTAGLAATAGLVEEARTTLDPFIEGLPEPALLALLEGPGERFGLVVLDTQVLAALIEMQTTGRVVARPAEPRVPTRTDAIMCADFIDRTLELVDERVREAELEVAPAVTGFRYAIALAEARAIAMSLEDIPYRRFRFDIDLGQGAKSGVMQILLPFDPPGERRKGGAEAEAFADAMRAQVMETEAVLTATLFRREMTLAQAARLQVGDILTLPRETLTAVSLEALDGKVVARGRLGQQNGHRAVRLEAENAAANAAHMADAASAAPPFAVDRPAPALPPGDAPALEPAGLAGLGTGPGGMPDDGMPDPGDLGSFGDLGNLGDGADLADLGDLSSLGDLSGSGE